MPRFVVLEHHHQGVHWDLLLEAGPMMRTWSLDRAPDLPGPIAARALDDHRTAFLEYEGPISAGRGHVVRWDRGTFTWVRRDDDHVEVALTGTRLAGTFRLHRDAGAWVLDRPPADGRTDT